MKRNTIHKTKAELEKELNILENKNKIFDILDATVMLIATAVGILVSKYIPEFKSGEEIILTLPSYGRLIIAIILSMGVMGSTEIKGDSKGKRKNFIKRLWFAIANGMAWYTMLGF